MYNLKKILCNKALIYNWIFILGLIILILNDHLLKWEFSNWLTGKLSDFIGLLIFPMFLQFLFPRIGKLSSLVTGLFFIFWKLPVSENFINAYNRIAIIPIVRIVDYSDLIALSILPFAHFFTQNIERFKINNLPNLTLNPLFLLVPASFAFMATSPPISFYMRPNGDIHIGKSYKIKMSREKFLEKLKAEGYAVRLDTIQRQEFTRNESYLIEDVVLSGGKDTIKSIEFGFFGGGDKTLLLLKNVNLHGVRKLSDWRELKRYSKHYQKIINSEIIEEVK